MGVGTGGAGVAPVSDVSLGSVTITVLHPITQQPVPRVPVTVLAVIKPEGKPMVYWTGRNGSVTITNLPEGLYNTYVEYNNQVSETVRFEIIADYHPFVTLYFNPDIDAD
jgi:hypothetical protein